MAELYAAAGSEARRWARGIAWLWGLGDVAPEPAAELIGFGVGVSDAERLVGLLDDGRLRAAVVGLGPGAAAGPIPARRAAEGKARFEPATEVIGEYTLFEGGAVAAGSSLGIHAWSEGELLALGYAPERDWGRLDSFWAFEAISEFLSARITGGLTRLGACGVLRLDDKPGTAQHQLEGRATPDRRQARSTRRIARQLRASGAILNVAVAAQALDDGRVVPLDRVWPRSVRALKAGIEAGVFEPVCHGLLHLDAEALTQSKIEYREFAHLDAEQAGRVLDQALAWQARQLREPRTFVAPAWSYGPAGNAEAAARGLVRWHRPQPGPLLSQGKLHETLIGALHGIYRLDYSPLQRLAAVGVPPTVTLHGQLLDDRLAAPACRRSPLTLARLFVVRDLSRMIRLEGIEWLGAGDFVDRLTDHVSRTPGTTGLRALEG